MYPIPGGQMRLLGSPVAGESYRPLNFLLVKVKMGGAFPAKAGKVAVKLVANPAGEVKSGEWDTKNGNAEVTVFFTEEEVDEGGATEVEVSLEASDKTPLGKTKLVVPSDRTLLNDSALSCCSLNNAELQAAVWWSGENNPDLLKVLKSGSRVYALPNLVYYHLWITYPSNPNSAVPLPPNSLYRVRATIGAQSSATVEIFNPSPSPTGGTLNCPVWFIKVYGNNPPQGELKVELQAAQADSGMKPCGEYKVVASGVQKLEEVYKKNDGVDVALKKPKSNNGGGEDDEGKKESALGVVRVGKGGEAPNCHVFEEEPDKCGDLRAPAQVNKSSNGPPAIGFLEVRVNNARIFRPMKVRGGKPTADTYCLVKYGRKILRTQTAFGSLCPVFNKGCNWDVFDTHTVFSVALFDNRQIPGAGSGGQKEVGDAYMGRVAIRISTLFPSLPALRINNTYLTTFPLYLIHPNPPDGHNVKHMARLTLLYRFTLYTSSFKHFLPVLFRSPLPPPNSWVPPEAEMLRLRRSAVALVAEHLSKYDPPLGKTAVEDMYGDYEPCYSYLRYDTHQARLRRAVAGFVFLRNSVVAAFVKPRRAVLFSLLFFLLFCCSHLIPHIILITFFIIGLYNLFLCFPKQPPGINQLLLDKAQAINAMVIDEEADTTPSSRPPEVIKARHDQLSSVVGGAERRVGRTATSVAKLRGLLRWWDPRATGIFAAFCVAGAAASRLTHLWLCCVLAAAVVVPLHLLEVKRRIPSPLSCFTRRLLNAPPSIL